MIKLTKKQFSELNNCHVGVGEIIFKSAENEITKIPFYTSKDNKVRRLTDHKEPELNITDAVVACCQFED